MKFIDVGFEFEGIQEKKRPYALAFGYNLKNSFTGAYPKVSMDFKKVRLTSGEMPVILSPAVEVVNEGFKFSWNPESTEAGTHWTDQVMLMAYFPRLKKAMYHCPAISLQVRCSYQPDIHCSY